MEERRQRMVADQLRANGISDPAVLRVMSEVPREEFVPAAVRSLAYDDRALGIGWGQTISQPLVVAAMTQALKLQAQDTVLEVGTGSGYQAAILSLLCKQVVSVELEPALAERAAANLRRLDYGNVKVAVGDGHLGWLARSPYQAILVACATPEVPAALVEQLDEDGRLVIPLGSARADHQDLRLLTKVGGSLASRDLFAVRFVPLR
jgi:protein-L-isoaspartate(D-aspartate) O-methyltransferase